MSPPHPSVLARAWRLPPAGAALVEAIVAIVLFGIGVLAFVGTAALTTRMIGEARRDTEAGLLASGLLGRLRGPACGEGRDGFAIDKGYVVRWRILGAAPARPLTVVVERIAPGRRRRTRLRSHVACIP